MRWFVSYPVSDDYVFELPAVANPNVIVRRGDVGLVKINGAAPRPGRPIVSVRPTASFATHVCLATSETTTTFGIFHVATP